VQDGVCCPKVSITREQVQGTSKSDDIVSDDAFFPRKVIKCREAIQLHYNRVRFTLQVQYDRCKHRRVFGASYWLDVSSTLIIYGPKGSEYSELTRYD
jgi:hypothetical protein